MFNPPSDRTNDIVWYIYNCTTTITDKVGRLRRTIEDIASKVEQTQATQDRIEQILRQEEAHRQDIITRLEANKWQLQAQQEWNRGHFSDLTRIEDQLRNFEFRATARWIEIQSRLENQSPQEYGVDSENQEGWGQQDEEEQQETWNTEVPLFLQNIRTANPDENDQNSLDFYPHPDPDAWSTNAVYNAQDNTPPNEEEPQEPREGLFQDYLGQEEEDYTHPDSPIPELPELEPNEEVESSEQSGESLISLLPVPVLNREFRTLGQRSRVDRGRSRSRRYTTIRRTRGNHLGRLVLNSLNSVRAVNPFAIELRDTSSESSSESLSEQVERPVRRTTVETESSSSSSSEQTQSNTSSRSEEESELSE